MVLGDPNFKMEVRMRVCGVKVKGTAKDNTSGRMDPPMKVTSSTERIQALASTYLQMAPSIRVGS